MVRIDRQTIDVTPNHNAGLLLSLLRAVMAKLAEALQVGRIEEQRDVTTVGFDVVGDVGGYHAALRGAAAAQWLGLKLIPPESIPILSLVETMPR
jgi:hypothetical protein